MSVAGGERFASTCAQYDRMAPHYGTYARTRVQYCDAIDRIITGRIAARGGAWLDIGSADGTRALRLAAAAGVKDLVLLEPSAAMADVCRRQHDAVWNMAAEDLPDEPARFHVVTCLWNVLGAILAPATRLAALRRMHAVLAPGGQLFLDVANRYNVRTGGLARVGARAIRDRFWSSPDSGIVHFVWRVNGEAIPARGYLFSSRELRSLFSDAGFRVVSRWFVDYRTGAACGPWTGQILFELTRA